MTTEDSRLYGSEITNHAVGVLVAFTSILHVCIAIKHNDGEKIFLKINFRF